MLKKFIGHILLLPYNILCFLIGTVIVVIGGFTGRFDGQRLAESIYGNKNSTGLFIFIQILVFIVSMRSAKLAGVVISVLFLSISVLGKYLLSNGGISFYQTTSKSNYLPDYQSNSNDVYQQQNRNDEERRGQDAERERQQREQQEYYERQQRESQQRHEEQMRRDEESRRRNWEEQQRRDEQNRRNWGV